MNVRILCALIFCATLGLYLGQWKARADAGTPLPTPERPSCAHPVGLLDRHTGKCIHVCDTNRKPEC